MKSGDRVWDLRMQEPLGTIIHIHEDKAWIELDAGGTAVRGIDTLMRPPGIQKLYEVLDHMDMPYIGPDYLLQEIAEGLHELGVTAP